MSRNNTGNPIGSKAFPDFEDNVKNLDQAANALQDTFQDRLGRSRLTWAGMESGFGAFIASSGYQFVGDYAAGIEITQYNQLVRDENGEFWRVSGQIDLPYTTTGNGVPENDALVPVGDAVLRQDLSAGSVFIDGDRSDRFVRGAASDVEITVGPGGDTDNLNAALVRAMKFRNTLGTSAQPLRVTVRILSGTVISQQALIERGIDMGHIEIISDDPIVLVDGSNMTRQTNLKAIYVDGSITDLPRAFFFAGENSTLPIIGCLFDMQGVGPDAVVVAYNSSAYIRIGCGVINSGGRGIYAIHGSHVVAHGTNFSGAGGNAVSIFRGSFVDFRTANGDNAGGLGMYCGSNSRCEALQASFKNAGSHGVEAYGASVAHVREASFEGAGGIGMYARDGAVISTRGSNLDNVRYHGIQTLNGGQVFAELSTIRNSGASAINCSEGGVVNFQGGIIEGASGHGIHANRGSRVTAEGVSISGCTGDGIRAQKVTQVNASASTISGCGGDGVRAESGSAVAVSSASTISGMGGELIYADGAGTSVDASRASLVGSSTGAQRVLADNGATINVERAVTSGNSWGRLEATSASIINANGAELSGGQNATVFASRASTINVNDATIGEPATGDAIWVARGATICATDTGSASCNQEPNILTINGVIYQD